MASGTWKQVAATMVEFSCTPFPGVFLQHALNVHGAGLVVDGIPGKQTRQMLKIVLAQTGESEFLSTLNERRKSFYRSCKQFPVFGKGWLNRSNEAYRFAQSLI